MNVKCKSSCIGFCSCVLAFPFVPLHSAPQPGIYPIKPTRRIAPDPYLDASRPCKLSVHGQCCLKKDAATDPALLRVSSPRHAVQQPILTHVIRSYTYRTCVGIPIIAFGFLYRH